MATTLNLGRVKGSFIYTGTGTDDAGIRSDLSSRGIAALQNDLYIGTADEKVYQYQISENEGNWVYLFTMKGETGTGAPGPSGAAATISIGTVTTGAAGSQAQVTNAGTASAAVFNFVIPQGAKGADGAAGENGKTPTLTINENGELVATFE